MKKIFSHLYKQLFKGAIQLNKALVSRKDFDIVETLKNKQIPQIMSNNGVKDKTSFGKSYDTNINTKNQLLLAPPEKQLFLPLPEKIPLIASYFQKEFVSGMVILTPEERNLLTQNFALGEEFRRILCLLFVKVPYSFSLTSFHTLEENLKLGIENLFGYSTALDMSPQLKKILGDRIITILQHFTVIYWSNRNFTFEHLNNLGKEYSIKCDTFINTDVKILSFIEMHFAIIFKKHIFNITGKKQDYHLINHEAVANSPTYFNEIDSRDRTRQKHADLQVTEPPNKVIENTNYFIDNVYYTSGEITKFYYEFKSFVTMSVYCCRFSIFHNNDKLLYRLINDLTVSFKKYITENKLTTGHPIYDLYKKIDFIKKIKPEQEIFQKYNKIINVLTPCIFDPKFQALKIGIALDAGKDLHFNAFYNKIKDLQDTLNTPESRSPRIIELLETMFPNSPTIDSKNNVENVRELLEILVPLEMRAPLMDHFETFVVKAVTAS